MAERVEIKLCIGLIGVCVLSLIGDESDGVFDDICSNGVDEWHDNLPEHDAPLEGIYTVICDVYFYEDDVIYEVVEVKDKLES